MELSIWWFTHQIDHVQSGYMGASMMHNPKHSIGESGPKKNCAWGFPKIGQNLQARSRDIWIAGHLPQPHQSHVQQLLCVTHGQAIETQTVEKSKAVLVKTSASSALNYPYPGRLPSEWHDAVSWVMVTVVTWCDMLPLSNPNFKKGVQNIRPNLSKCLP